MSRRCLSEIVRRDQQALITKSGYLAPTCNEVYTHPSIKRCIHVLCISRAIIRLPIKLFPDFDRCSKSGSVFIMLCRFDLVAV
jgi:hypothetical protein